ncbi:MAG: BBE domain-containing protein [Planctomycetota bacterium]
MSHLTVWQSVPGTDVPPWQSVPGTDVPPWQSVPGTDVPPSMVEHPGEERVRQAYSPEVWSRLVEVKWRWDPDNFFRFRISARSEGDRSRTTEGQRHRAGPSFDSDRPFDQSRLSRGRWGRPPTILRWACRPSSIYAFGLSSRFRIG